MNAIASTAQPTHLELFCLVAPPVVAFTFLEKLQGECLVVRSAPTVDCNLPNQSILNLGCIDPKRVLCKAIYQQLKVFCTDAAGCSLHEQPVLLFENERATGKRLSKL